MGHWIDQGETYVDDTPTVDSSAAPTQAEVDQFYHDLYQGKGGQISKADVTKVQKQILDQGTTSQWKGQGFGSAEANALDMAKSLVASGVTDINKIGQGTVYANQPVTERLTYNGQVPRINDAGQYYVLESTGDDYATPKIIQPSDLKKELVIAGSDMFGEGSYTPLTAEQQKAVKKDASGQMVVPIASGTGIINKDTGEKILSNYNERTVGNAFGGTYAGEGNTAYRVQFDAQGNPIFYTTGASSNTLANMLSDSPILNAVANLGAAYFGGPLGTAALQAAQGKSVEDIAKAAALSYAAGQVGQGVSSGLTDTLGSTAANIAGKVAGQEVVTGGKADIGKLLTNAAISGGINELANTGPSSSDMIEGYFAPGGEGYIAPTPSAEQPYTPTTDYSVPADYSLFGGSTAAPTLEEMGGAQGIQAPAVNEQQNVGYEPIDYSLNTNVPFEGLQMPTAPNIDSMGGGQGLTVPVAGGTLTESGFIPSTYVPALGDPNSFINQPAPTGGTSAADTAAKAAATKAASDAAAKAASDKAAADAAARAKAAADAAAKARADAQVKAYSDAIARQQAQQNALLNMMDSNNAVANIKSYKDLYGHELFGPEPASSAQTSNAFSDLSGFGQQFSSGGDVDALLHLLRS